MIALERLLESNKSKTEKKEEFKPYLLFDDKKSGIIGAPTKIIDAVLIPLKIGDVVRLYSGGKHYNDHVIMNDYGKDFVKGIECCCEPDGTISDDWKIIKIRGFEDVADGETVDNTKYIKSPSKE
jgi:hypothetical protein